MQVAPEPSTVEMLQDLVIYETQQCNSISKCKMHVCKAQLCIKFIYKYATHFAKTLGTVWQMLNHFNQLQTSFLFYFYSYPWLSLSEEVDPQQQYTETFQQLKKWGALWVEHMHGKNAGWVGGGSMRGALKQKANNGNRCTIIIAKAQVKRYLVVKKLSPAII